MLCRMLSPQPCSAAADGATITLGANIYTWPEETIVNKRITIVGAGQGSTTLDRKLGGRFFTINSGGHVTVKHLTITGGRTVRLLALLLSCSRFCFRVRFTDTCSCLVVLLLALRWSMHCGCLSCGRCCHICARSHTQGSHTQDVSRAMVVLLAWLLRCFARAFAFVCVSLTLALVLLCCCLLCAGRCIAAVCLAGAAAISVRARTHRL